MCEKSPIYFLRSPISFYALMGEIRNRIFLFIEISKDMLPPTVSVSVQNERHLRLALFTAARIKIPVTARSRILTPSSIWQEPLSNTFLAAI